MSAQYRQGDVLLIKLAEAEADALRLRERARPARLGDYHSGLFRERLGYTDGVHGDDGW